MWLVATRVGPFSDASIGDMFVYDNYQGLMRQDGLVPYRDFDFEYPPGALVTIWLAGGDDVLLSVIMMVCALVCQRCAWAISGWKAGWAMALIAPVAGALVRTHFDLLPAALAMVGLALVVTRRPQRGWVELAFAVFAVGTMTKLWPAAVAAVALVWLHGRGERRAAYRGAAVLAIGIVAIGLPFALLGGFPDTMVRFHLDRPIQIESIAATVLEITGGSYVTGAPIRNDIFKSNGLDGGGADVVAALSTLALLGVGLWVLWQAWRRPTVDALVLAALAIVLTFVDFSKVLSPQYMVWILPFAAIAGARPGAWHGPALAAGASLATQLWFPVNYFDVVYQKTWAVLAVGFRNGLLLAALAATATALARSPAHDAEPQRSG